MAIATALTAVAFVVALWVREYARRHGVHLALLSEEHERLVLQVSTQRYVLTSAKLQLTAATRS